MKILVTPTSIRTAQNSDLSARLGSVCDEIVYNPHGRPLQADELLGLLSDCEGYIAGLDFITADVIRACPALKIISRYGTGLDRVDLTAARYAGILVTNTPGGELDRRRGAHVRADPEPRSHDPLAGPQHPVRRLGSLERRRNLREHHWHSGPRRDREEAFNHGAWFRDDGPRLRPTRRFRVRRQKRPYACTVREAARRVGRDQPSPATDRNHPTRHRREAVPPDEGLRPVGKTRHVAA